MHSHIKSAISLATVAAFSFAGGAFATTYAVPMFKDVPGTHWASDAITYVAQAGLMKGPADKPGYFEPDAVVTRAQLATIIYRGAGSPSLYKDPVAAPGDARNAQRRSDVNTILNAIYQYAIDNNGQIPVTLTETPEEICKSTESNCSDLIDLKVLTGMYIVNVPSDPQSDSGDRGTGYFISLNSKNRITVEARGAEDGATISVSR